MRKQRSRFVRPSLSRRRSLTIAIAVNDFPPALRDDRTLFGRHFVGVGFVVRMVGKVLSQARQILLEIAQFQIVIVRSTQLPFGISDQILVAQFVEARRINEFAPFV